MVAGADRAVTILGGARPVALEFSAPLRLVPDKSLVATHSLPPRILGQPGK
jgi:hypothetical protein